MSPIIVPDLETVWQANRAGLITWASVQQAQADRMPRCVNHPDRAAVVIHGGPVCEACFMAIMAAGSEAQRSATQEVVRYHIQILEGAGLVKRKPGIARSVEVVKEQGHVA